MQNLPETTLTNKYVSEIALEIENQQVELEVKALRSDETEEGNFFAQNNRSHLAVDDFGEFFPIPDKSMFQKERTHFQCRRAKTRNTFNRRGFRFPISTTYSAHASATRRARYLKNSVTISPIRRERKQERTKTVTSTVCSYSESAKCLEVLVGAQGLEPWTR
jgi:hypothetical protein